MPDERKSWRGIEEQFKQYIRDGKWLRKLAEEGLLERRRKGGTRVVQHPVRVAKLDIPIIRQMVEERGGKYRHEILISKVATAPLHVHKKMQLLEDTSVLQVDTLYYSNSKAFAYERRWVNIAQVPEITKVDFERVSINEWLVNNVPLSNCDIQFSAKNATKKEADLLGTNEDKAILVLDRSTWLNEKSVTHVRLCFKPGYEMVTSV